MPGVRRRTPGLRRDEVALLAGMSTDYYTRLEQSRGPNPSVQVLSHLTWDNVSIPQTDIPVTIHHHRYLVEVDEFSRNVTASYDAKDPVGAARIIDIADDTRPFVVSNIRLEVHRPENRAGDQSKDPGATNGLQGYAGHYCAVPSRDEPGVVACSFILSGLRLFDIRDPSHPKELAYSNFPAKATEPGQPPSAYVMCAAAFVPERSEIWYSDGNSGFYALRVTNGVWPFGGTACQRRTTVDFRLHRVPGTRAPAHGCATRRGRRPGPRRRARAAGSAR